MPKSQTRGERLALKSTKIVGSQPTSDGEAPEASPTRKSTRVRDNALSQSPGKNMPQKNPKKVDKQNDRHNKPTLTMQTDAAAEKSDRLRTPISTSSSSSTLTLVRSGSSTTTQEPSMKNGMSHTPQPNIPSSGKIIRERSLPAPNASESKKKHVFPKDNDGLSDDIEDESSEDFPDDIKRKRRSRAALDNSFDHSGEDNCQQTSTKITRGETNKNSLEINANDKSRIRTPHSARKKQSPPQKKGKLAYDDEYTYTTTSSSRSRASTPQVENISGKIDGNQDAHLPYHEAAIGNIPLCLYAKLAPPRNK
jgi:hypothetical protein